LHRTSTGALLCSSRLPLPERLEIVETLWDSIAADAELPVRAKQAQELDRRLLAHELNAMGGGPWEEIRDRLHKRK
jgi:putative addiction module component (TIGR02574 family)